MFDMKIYPFFKRLFDIPPSILMRNGKINIKELSKNRLTAEELLSQLRLSGYFEMSEISCAVLEPNGQILADFLSGLGDGGGNQGLEPG